MHFHKFHKHLKALFHAASDLMPNSASHGSSIAAKDFWNRWQEERDSSDSKLADWGEHPAFLSNIYQELFGSSDVTVFEYLRRHFPEFANATALSLCSGDGSFERLLIEQRVFKSIVGVDQAEERVKRALSHHRDLTGQLDFGVSDINLGEFGSNRYDVVFAKAALHHAEDLDGLFLGINRALKPGGHLVTIDFFGPSRFQWTDVQLEHASSFLKKEIPPEYLRTGDGTFKEIIVRPTVKEMIEADPSEAARSGELMKYITDNFAVVRDFEIGGTLVNLIFTPDVINNFSTEDSEALSIIGKAFRYERELIKGGIIPSDFRFIIARKME